MKIDFHIHTFQNRFLDRSFSFNGDFLKEYVVSNSIEAIAITNHNLFDKANFAQVEEALKGIDCLVFPGIEISLENGHILVIFNNDHEAIGYLEMLHKHFSGEERDDHYKMCVSDFNRLCCGKNALIIPHYDKSPKIHESIISQISERIFVGEVDSPKKFYKLQKEEKGIAPVLFSDIRIGESGKEEDYRDKSRFTYVDCSTKNFESIVSAIKCNAVYLSKDKIQDQFDILNGNAKASTGINVLIGKRSSGKTYTLNHICEKGSANYLYIEQFEITKNCKDDEFLQKVHEDEKKIVFDYAKGINRAFDILDNEISNNPDIAFSDYVSSLKECASECVADVFSKCHLYHYSPVAQKNTEEIEKLFVAVNHLLSAENDFKTLVEKHLRREELVALYNDLVEEKKHLVKANKLIEITNTICKTISGGLGRKSCAKQISRCDLNAFFRFLYVKRRFDSLIKQIDKREVASESVFNKFKKKTYLLRQKDKRSWKSDLGYAPRDNIDYFDTKSPSDAYIYYKNDTSVHSKKTGDERFAIFYQWETSVLNENGAPISGGQRAEYSLLNKLTDYKRFDVVLIDEMESSFDNPFLNSEVIDKIRLIGQTATVFVSTHNNNLGVSLRPDYYIYHEVDTTNGDPVFMHYCGKASDIMLTCPNGGKTKPLSKILVDTMEANEEAYSQRKEKYEVA